MKDIDDNYLEDATPNPEYLIKSIAEQGYSLESSLADLIDNSISAKADKIEILIDSDKKPFILFLVDNGAGMDEVTLKKCMQFPSSSPETKRNINDLGRFGLGMKTASFSQTRKFTVISRKKGSEKYSARTWDVDLLEKTQKWKLIINSEKEIDDLVSQYKSLSTNYLNEYDEFVPNTIVVWDGLYKFDYIHEEKNQRKELKREITEVTAEHLSLVFHRYMESKEGPLNIRINNILLVPFNPFPTNEKDFRPIEYKQRTFGDDSIKIEGYVLPSRSISETRKGLTHWTTKNRGLMDMEGIYIYRANRIIIFGGWNGLIKKSPRLQLARLKVEIGNSADHLLNLNVAKSQVIIPHELKDAFKDYISQLKVEAEREYYNRGLSRFPKSISKNKAQLFERIASSKGTILEINNDFPLINSLREGIPKHELSKLNMVIKMVNTTINKLRESHEEIAFVEEDDMPLQELILCLNELKENGFDDNFIKKNILPDLGYKLETLPDEILELLS